MTTCVCGHEAEDHDERGCSVPDGCFEHSPEMAADHNVVNHPAHYTAHPSGVECIEITEHMSFNVGNAIKYLWRADLKANPIEDLRKAEWYVRREIGRRLEQYHRPR